MHALAVGLQSSHCTIVLRAFAFLLDHFSMVHVQVCMYVYVYTYVEARGQHQMFSLVTSPPYFGGQSLSLNLELQID